MSHVRMRGLSKAFGSVSAVREPTTAAILGDTPADGAAADAVGFPFLAVATGAYDEAALRATSARIVIPDLEAGLPALLEALGAF